MDELLKQAIDSGQVSPAQIEAHRVAGELDVRIERTFNGDEFRFDAVEFADTEPPGPERLTYDEFRTIRNRIGIDWFAFAQEIEAAVLRKNGLL